MGLQLEEEEGRAFSSKRRRHPHNLEETLRRWRRLKERRGEPPKPLLSSLLTLFSLVTLKKILKVSLNLNLFTIQVLCYASLFFTWSDGYGDGRVSSMSFQVSLCLFVLMSSYLYVFPLMLVSCYALVENGDLWDVGMIRKGILCVFGHSLCLWVMLC